VMKREEDSPTSTDQQSPTPMAWAKIPSVSSSKEHENLPQGLKDFLDMPTVPTIEIATASLPIKLSAIPLTCPLQHTPPSFLSHTVSPDTSFLGAICLVFNPQSRGVCVQKQIPTCGPLISGRLSSSKVLTPLRHLSSTLTSSPTNMTNE